MPRLSRSLIQRAHRVSPAAAALLPTCRDLTSALNELRWIREHVHQTGAGGSSTAEHHVRKLVRLRAKGVPLQYVLGTQPFGHLEIKCRPGVLIPRPEPEAYATHLASLLKAGLLSEVPAAPTRSLHILDLCTGTGCIALHLFALLSPTTPHLSIHALDISPAAISLARANLRHNVHLGLMHAPTPSQALTFHLADMFGPGLASDLLATLPRWDVLTCNPPYISPHGHAHSTARAVRNYEPKLAQVPEPREGFPGCAGEDVFYARLLDIAGELGPRVVLSEVGDLEQARRVVELANKHVFSRGGTIEIWGDSPDGRRGSGEPATVDVGGREIKIRGSGAVRSVFIYRGLQV